MDALAIERAVGIATSYGTVILADLAQSNPGSIGAMMFACGVTGMGHLEPQERARLRTVRRAEIESMGQRKFAEMRNSTYVAKGMSAALVARVVELAGSAQPEGYLQAYGALTESNIFQFACQYRRPCARHRRRRRSDRAGARLRAGGARLAAGGIPLHRELRALREPGAGGNLQRSGRRFLLARAESLR